MHFPLSGPVLTYISLLIIPCMIEYVTNNKEPWTPGWIKIHFKFLIITPLSTVIQTTNKLYSEQSTFTLSKNNHWLQWLGYVKIYYVKTAVAALLNKNKMLLNNPSFFKSLTFCTSCNGDFELSKILNSTASSYIYAFIYVGYTEKQYRETRCAFCHLMQSPWNGARHSNEPATLLNELTNQKFKNL